MTVPWFRNSARFVFPVILILLTGCPLKDQYPLERKFGQAEPRSRQAQSLAAGQVDFWQQVKPVLDNRCVMCHGCYDAPCQLKLTSIEGIERGASRQTVYRNNRLIAEQPNRLFEDAFSVFVWRQRGFHPVLSEYPNELQANRLGSVMYRHLQLKKQADSSSQPILSDHFNLSLARKQQCPSAGSFDRFARKYPDWGMPFGLPAISANEHQILSTWIEQGAMWILREEEWRLYQAEIDRWESFLNQETAKAQLVSRYLFEHLFLAHFYFPNKSVKPGYFRLVRSRTPPGVPVALIATRRPYDDPGVARVYYRLQPLRSTVLAKTHLPYALHSQRMDNWRKWFFSDNYTVDQMPDYLPEYASNPFLTFKAIPWNARYRFLLDEAQFSIMNFIKGPVCSGQVALNVINDNFWVFFLDPDFELSGENIQFFEEQFDRLHMPAAKTSNLFRPISAFREFSGFQKNFIATRARYFKKNFSRRPYGLDIVWDGEGKNDNAALTVFRHFDSASVEKGLLGQPPKTAWLLGYSELERIHYLLVAGFDVYGNVGHQLITRVYMDFLRMESETNFLHLLPGSVRQKERDEWYRGAEEAVEEYMLVAGAGEYIEPVIDYRGPNFKQELFMHLSDHLSPVMSGQHRLANDRLTLRLADLQWINNTAVQLLPQTSIIEVKGADNSQYFTLIRNNAHKNILTLFSEESNRLPVEDSLSLLPGIIGNYPNIFFRVAENEIGNFIKRLDLLRDEDDWFVFRNDYGIRRTHRDFWRFSDQLHAHWQAQDPVGFGRLDFNRLENR